MQLNIVDKTGKTTGRTANFPDVIFNREPNDHAIYLAVKQYLAAQRQGTSKVKTRAEVQGSSKKLHKQKGTGGSRKGNLRSPIFKGGGTIFGPKPRDYDFKLNKKVKDLAKISALSHKAKNNAIIVLENLNLTEPKTKQIADILENLKLANKKTLIVTAENNQPLLLSSRNIPKASTALFTDINTYAITNADVLVFLENVSELFKEMETAQ